MGIRKGATPALQSRLGRLGALLPSLELAREELGHQGLRLDEKTVRHELEGNLCRCTGYHNIVKAILAAAGEMGAGARMAAE